MDIHDGDKNQPRWLEPQSLHVKPDGTLVADGLRSGVQEHPPIQL